MLWTWDPNKNCTIKRDHGFDLETAAQRTRWHLRGRIHIQMATAFEQVE